MNYWEKRNIEREAALTKKSRETIEKELATQYARSLQAIKTQINALYGRFSSQNGLSIAEGKKLLTGDEYRIWRMDMEEYLSQIKAGDKGLLKELNTLAMRTRISRLEKLYGETLKEIDSLGRDVSDRMRNFLTDAYNDGYYHNAYDMGKTGILLSTKMLEPRNIEAVLRTPWSGKNYSQRIWSNGRKLATTLKNTIFNGVHRGISVEKMTSEVVQRMEVSRHEAIRLVRTEMNYINNRANLDSLEEAGMKYFRFVATLDSRTSTLCREHDGKVYPVSEAKQGNNAPPLHPHCRSIVVGELKGYDRSKHTRAARKGKDWIEVPSKMEYADWDAVFVKKTKTLDEWLSANKPPEVPKKAAESTAAMWKAKYEAEKKAYDKSKAEFDAFKLEMDEKAEEARKQFGYYDISVNMDFDEWDEHYRELYDVVHNKGKVTEWMKDNWIRKKDAPGVLKREYEEPKETVEFFRKQAKYFAELKDKVEKLEIQYKTSAAEMRLAMAEGESLAEKVTWLREHGNFAEFTDFDMIVIGKRLNEELKLIDKLENPEQLKEAFGKVRKMGGRIPEDRVVSGSSFDIYRQLNEAFDFYPADWSNRITTENLYIRAAKKKRGCFVKELTYVKSGRVYIDESVKLPNGARAFSIFTDGKQKSTPFHEIGHYIEWINPDAGRLSKEFLARRTKNEQEVLLKELFPGSNYDVNEVTKLDNFANAYMGKTYDDASEILSMGLESVFVNGEHVQRIEVTKEKRYKLIRKHIRDDEEYLEFIFGMLGVM